MDADEAIEDTVVLVDEQDRPVGVSAKMAAHEGNGALHRAISVFLFDGRGRLLLQQRASAKHHFRGLWANTCCTHPRPGEGAVEAGERRLFEEMGIQASLRAIGTFVYRAVDPATGLVEHELDHVLVGRADADPRPDPEEVADWAWVDPASLAAQLRVDDAGYVPWLAPALAVFPGRALGSPGHSPSPPR